MNLNEAELKLSKISSHQGTMIRAIADHILAGETRLSYSSENLRDKTKKVLQTLGLFYHDNGVEIRMSDRSIEKIAPAVSQFKKRK